MPGPGPGPACAAHPLGGRGPGPPQASGTAQSGTKGRAGDPASRSPVPRGPGGGVRWGRGEAAGGRGGARAGPGARGRTGRRREAAPLPRQTAGAAPPAPPLRSPPPPLGRPESRPPAPRRRTCSNFLGRAGPRRRCRRRARVSRPRRPGWGVGPCPFLCLRPTSPSVLRGRGLLLRSLFGPSAFLPACPGAAPRAALALSARIAR